MTITAAVPDETTDQRSPANSPPAGPRPRVLGKFLFVGKEKLYIRGVTYGTFRPGPDGSEFHDRSRVQRDFAQIAANGINAIRIYTVPPRWLLDEARRQGLHVMVGLPWEQHIAFLDDRDSVRSIEERVRAGVAACAGHPAVLCYVIGNEIPAQIVRWHGARRVERFLRRLYDAAKAVDPEGLVTYVNYPSTEYLRLPFVDLVCFNVYLERHGRLKAYLARLHSIAGERPLVMAEVGLDSGRHGEDAQGRVLDWQVRTAFGSGCAGVFVFAWTDEWHRGGYDIDDWCFGLTCRDRRPKPALAAVRTAFSGVPLRSDLRWPRISVVVCSYNGAATIRQCLDGLMALEYPNYEVIVVDDGSTDETAAIIDEYPFRRISTENRGLSSARNTGLHAAGGDIVAYTDDDAWPDPHWLSYLAATFMTTPHVGVGGPNIAPPGDGLVADCVANAPGSPMHVLLSDTEAEHIPGCNMAFRRDALLAIGGFDTRFRVAGDDVDVCWRLQERGWTLGFHPAAMVWHHRRRQVRAYWKQQHGYGKAEAMLERKWPEKYNSVGHLLWTGRIYGKGLSKQLSWGRERIYHGTWGSALFQSIYEPAPGLLASLPLMPEWYLLISLLAAMSLLGAVWRPLLAAVPLFVLAAAAPVVQAICSAAHASFTTPGCNRWRRLRLHALTAFLHLLQPVARLCGRIRFGLSPWRSIASSFSLPWPSTVTLWSERWQAADERLLQVDAALRAAGASVLRGGVYDRWDLRIRGGPLGDARTRMTIEEHGGGRQLIRFRIWPRCSRLSVAAAGMMLALAGVAASDQAALVAELFCAAGTLLLLLVVRVCCSSMGLALRCLRDYAAAHAAQRDPEKGPACEELPSLLEEDGPA